jgi:hypothetical protein
MKVDKSNQPLCWTFTVLFLWKLPKIILQYHQSGDVHIAVYDVDGDEMDLAFMKLNING